MTLLEVSLLCYRMTTNSAVNINSASVLDNLNNCFDCFQELYSKVIYVFAGSIKFLISFKRKITDSCFNFIGGRSLSSLFFSCSRIHQHLQVLNTSHISLREKCLYSELFWSAFFCIWNDCRETVSLQIHTECRKMADQNNSEYRHFLCSFYLPYKKVL